MIVIGTRGSALALAQARIVADALGGGAEVQVIKTAGDASDRPISELGDGVFVGAIEHALLRGDIDIAVHSLKDLPTTETAGLVIAAVPGREDPRDVLVTRGRGGPADLHPGARIGTSSPRRAAFLRAVVPGAECVEIRGNVDTRLRKVRDGEYDAVVLAAAGLRRLGIPFDEPEALPLDVCPPAPGQAALAVQTRVDHPERRRIRELLDDPHVHRAVAAEREVLRLLGASCEIPLGCHARSHGGEIVLDAALAADDGIHRAHVTGHDPLTVAREAAELLGATARV